MIRVFKLFAVLCFVAMLPVAVHAGCESCVADLNLPAGSVTVQLPQNDLDEEPAAGLVTARLSNIPAGYDISDGVYRGWCADLPALPVLEQTHAALLLSSYNLPEGEYGPRSNWRKVNYVLNHQGAGGLAVQIAIWRLLGHQIPPEDPFSAADALVAEAEQFGEHFVPGPGQKVGVIVKTAPVGNRFFQGIIIEVPVPFGEIGDFVWLDANRNGIQDPGERGLGGVELKLIKDNTVVTSMVSSENGSYLFEGLRPGDYTVAYETPSGYLTSPTLQASDTALDSNQNRGLGVSLPAGGSDRTFDFGFYELNCTGSIGNLVWHDLDADGIQDANEPGLKGVTVSLNGQDKTKTDAFGYYRFGALCPGTYQVSVSTPCGFSTTIKNAPDSTTATDSDAPSVIVTLDGTDETIDFGFVKPTVPPPPGVYFTFTQGGWGSKPAGHNPGMLLKTYFTLVFGANGVSIGSDSRKVTFTTAKAIQDFLPQGGTPSVLRSSTTNPTINPTSTAAGVFAGQVLALTLSVEFSAKGIRGPTDVPLGNLFIASGALKGQTVNDVLGLANRVLAGGDLPAGLTISGLNDIVDRINNNFDDGTRSNGFVVK